VGDLVIIADTREPNPDDPNEKDEALFWPTVYRGGAVIEVTVRRATLATGDYSLPGLEELVAIERKTLPDLIGTLFGSRKNSVGDGVSNQDRFRDELGRMADIRARDGRAFIVVEASREDVWRHRYQSRVMPVNVINAVDSFLVDYDIATVWAGDRAGAQLLVGTALARIWEQHRGVGDAYAKAVSRGRATLLPWILSSTAALGDAQT
jgi:ERCC4-type nuclease